MPLADARGSGQGEREKQPRAAVLHVPHLGAGAYGSDQVGDRSLTLRGSDWHSRYEGPVFSSRLDAIAADTEDGRPRRYCARRMAKAMRFT